jgi:hypothetical protein
MEVVFGVVFGVVVVHVAIVVEVLMFCEGNEGERFIRGGGRRVVHSVSATPQCRKSEDIACPATKNKEMNKLIRKSNVRQINPLGSVFS